MSRTLFEGHIYLLCLFWNLIDLLFRRYAGKHIIKKSDNVAQKGSVRQSTSPNPTLTSGKIMQSED